MKNINKNKVKEVYNRTKSYRKTGVLMNISHTTVYRIIHGIDTRNKYRDVLSKIEEKIDYYTRDPIAGFNAIVAIMEEYKNNDKH